MKTLLTLLMLTLFVSCGSDNTTDTGDKGITVDPGTETYAYNPVDTIHGSLSYTEFTEAVKQGKFLDNNYNDCTATFQEYHIERNTAWIFQTWVRVNDDTFSREINNGDLDYIFDSNSGATSDYMDVVIMLNEIVESRDTRYQENQVGNAAYMIRTTSGVEYLIDLNISILQNPVRMYDGQTEEGFDYFSMFCRN